MTATQVLNVTAKAAEQIKARLDEEPEATALRIGVKARGCSGMAYFMEFAKDVEEGDEVVEQNGVKIFVDPNSMVFMLGTKIDYVTDDEQEGFVFDNPNEKGRCGCGESFNA
jgi:iron-sulfur cluster assembly protein